MPLIAELSSPCTTVISNPIADAAHEGLSASPKFLPPWLFYDEAGSQLFEQITALPEYYLSRTERSLLAEHSAEILRNTGPVTIVELGAGTAAKTGILLQAATALQHQVLYQPIDVSPTALDEARSNIEAMIPGVTVLPQVANYILEHIRVQRQPQHSILALYIGSSIGNFSPAEALAILENLRRQLRPGDHLLLGTDLAPSANKPVSRLLAAYDDAQGITAQFNRNILTRLNRDLGADFQIQCFEHQARWNPAESRIEMHLVSHANQTVHLPANAANPALSVHFTAGETIHTENSYKFTPAAVTQLLGSAGFAIAQSFFDPHRMFAVTLAQAVTQ